ncbi:MAG: [protein-PII] uridylyltransferase [Pseudomonadota bacterium]|nr:[protein-PII] uridylyltransferase [Pseudomonadota bacterium]
MANIPKPREIINRKALICELDNLVEWSGYQLNTQARVLEIFKSAHASGWTEVRRRFKDDRISGGEAISANAYLIDQLVRGIYDFAVTRVYPSANPTTGEQMAVVATGGYGRGELAPYSDIDLMFLLPYKLTAHSEQVVEFVLYLLWDLGLKVGHATRSVDEALRLAYDDMTIRTALLESRWLWGNEPLFKEFKQRFGSEVITGSGTKFVEAKLCERNARHERMGDTRYVLEPNIKEGKGGLRDLQTLFWIAKYLYRVEGVEELKEAGVLTAEDVRRFAKASNFLWTVRCHLHYIACRPEERLTLNVQSDLGSRMGYRDRAGARGVERFMKHYFLTAKAVGDLTRVLCAVLEDQQKKARKPSWLQQLSFRKPGIEGFEISGGRVNVTTKEDFKRDPVKLIRLFHLAQRHELDIHPNALRLVAQSLRLIDGDLRRNPDANRLFMEILTGTTPEITLRRMNEAGVFGRFIPDFGRVVAQMQYDMYHVYTVDEHTIRAIGILAGIETGQLAADHPVSHSVIGEVQSRQAMYLGVLLHDIAKGRGGDHSEIGAEIAIELGPRLGLNEWETETVSWLVLHHLLMSRTAFKRDIDDPKTVSDFVKVVQSPERLRLLLVLTIADIRAVGPNVWNNWKAALLHELYWRAQEEMSGGVPTNRRAERVESAKQRLRENLSYWPRDEIERHIERGHDNYWLTVDPETQLKHARLIRAAEKEHCGIYVEIHVETERAVTKIVIYTQDHPGLFAAIAGAMALTGASIVDAKILTLANGMALDTFWVQNTEGAAFASRERLKKLRTRIEKSIEGRLRPAQELIRAQKDMLPSRTRVFRVPPRVLIDNKASNTHTLIEINGRDRPGLLHDVTAAITETGLQISTARISTYGERVVDVFYVKDVFGLKVERDDKIETIRGHLLEAIAETKPPPSKNKAGGADAAF